MYYLLKVGLATEIFRIQLQSSIHTSSSSLRNSAYRFALQSGKIVLLFTCKHTINCKKGQNYKSRNVNIQKSVEIAERYVITLIKDTLFTLVNTRINIAKSVINEVQDKCGDLVLPIQNSYSIKHVEATLLLLQ